MQPAELESKRSSPSYADMLLLVHGASTGKATASDDRATCSRVQVQIYYRLTDRFAVSSDLSNPGWVGAVVSVCQQQGSWKVWIETKGGQFFISLARNWNAYSSNNIQFHFSQWVFHTKKSPKFLSLVLENITSYEAYKWTLFYLHMATYEFINTTNAHMLLFQSKYY